jgi:hypothetical protein
MVLLLDLMDIVEELARVPITAFSFSEPTTGSFIRWTPL